MLIEHFPGPGEPPKQRGEWATHVSSREQQTVSRVAINLTCVPRISSRTQFEGYNFGRSREEERETVKRAKIDNRRNRKKGIVYRDGLNFPEVRKNVIPLPSW